MKIVCDVLSAISWLAIAGMTVFTLTDLLGRKDEAVEAIDAEFKLLEEPAPPGARRSFTWQDSPSREIASQLFMEGLPEEVMRALRHNAKEMKKVQRWRHYAEHAKKGRTRKKYRNRLREYYWSRPAPVFPGAHTRYWLPASPGYSSGRGLNSGSPEIIWWCRRPGPIYPVGEGGRVADWGPRPW